jgi:hypothetical protein
MQRLFSNLAPLVVLFALCAVASLIHAQERPRDPATLVQLFYDSYPNELEGGLPEGEDLVWISRFLSDRLYQRFRSTLAYQQEWIRQHPDEPPVIHKPPFADGVHFTGAPDAISAFKVLRAQSRAPGLWHVPIHFWYDGEYESGEAVVVVKEQRAQYVIDDIIFLPSESGGEPWCLFQSLEW